MKKVAKTIGINLALILAAALVSLGMLGYEPGGRRAGLWLAWERVTEAGTDGS